MQFYVTKNGEQLGPFSLMDVRQRLQSGALTYTDLAWREGMKDWAPLSELMGGALPDATPHAVSTWEPAAPRPQPQAPTGLRVVTALVICGILIGVLFVLAFFAACLVGGFVAGFQAGLQHPADGTQAGREAGGDFARTNMPLIMGGSALFSLVVSPIIAWLMAFSDLFPWCRKR